MFTAADFTFTLKSYFEQRNCPVRSFKSPPESVELLGSLVVSFVLIPAESHRLDVFLEAPELDNNYISFMSLKSLRDFYATIAKAAFAGFERSNLIIRDRVLLRDGERFKFSGTFHTSDKEHAFRAVYDGCIRPTLHYIRTQKLSR